MKQLVNFEFDPDELKADIENAESLEKDPKVFKQLAKIALVKQKLAEAQDTLKSLEGLAKVTINDRAKALYGTNWTAISGDGFKITRSQTGSVYEIGNPEKASEYVEVEVKPDSKKINAYLKANSALPDGIVYNPDRGESIRITVK